MKVDKKIIVTFEAQESETLNAVFSVALVALRESLKTGDHFNFGGVSREEQMKLQRFIEHYFDAV